MQAKAVPQLTIGCEFFFSPINSVRFLRCQTRSWKMIHGEQRLETVGGQDGKTIEKEVN